MPHTGLTMTIERYIERAAEVVGSYGNYKQAPDVVDAITIVMPRVALINGQLDEFTRYVYRMDDSGRHINLAGNTQIPTGVWTPWGSKGKLTRTERDVMRAFMRSFGKERPTPLYFYAAIHRRWFVNTAMFDTLPMAQAWVARHQMTAQDYLKYGGLIRRGTPGI